MKSVTVTLEQEHIERLDELTGDDGEFGNRSEAVRALISQHSDIEELEIENERLKREKRRLIAQMEENQELREYVSEEQELLRERERRRNAPIWKKAYWTIFGRGDQNVLEANDVRGKLMPSNDNDEIETAVVGAGDRRDRDGDQLDDVGDQDDRDEFVCDRCGTGGFALPEVMVDRYGTEDEEVVCPDCMTVDDRIID